MARRQIVKIDRKIDLYYRVAGAADQNAIYFLRDYSRRGRDKGLKSAIKKGGLEGAYSYMWDHGYSELSSAVILAAKRYSSLLIEHDGSFRRRLRQWAKPKGDISRKNLEKVRQSLPQKVEKSQAKRVILNKTCWNGLARMSKAESKDALEKLLAFSDALSKSRGSEYFFMLGGKIPGLHYEGVNLFTIETLKGNRLAFELKGDLFLVFRIFWMKDAKHDYLEDLLRIMNLPRAEREKFMEAQMKSSGPLL